MSRMYDRIMANGIKTFNWRQSQRCLDSVHMMLKGGMPVFKINNVASYWIETTKYANPTEIPPNVAPPFDRFFMEFGGAEIPTWGEAQAKSSGAIFDCVKIDDYDKIALAGDVSVDITDANWLIMIHTFIEPLGEKAWGPLATWQLAVKKDGSCGDYQKALKGAANMLPKEHTLNDASDALVFSCATIMPCLLAVSFMHCKNVKTITNDPPKALSKSYQKKHGRPLVRYHTLEIEPMKKILATEGRSGQVGLQKALHICRGHFANYGDEYGTGKLFGKHEGQYWIPSHVRGRNSDRTVIKDYDVKTPRV